MKENESIENSLDRNQRLGYELEKKVIGDTIFVTTQISVGYRIPYCGTGEINTE